MSRNHVLLARRRRRSRRRHLDRRFTQLVERAVSAYFRTQRIRAIFNRKLQEQQP